MGEQHPAKKIKTSREDERRYIRKRELSAS